MDSKYLNKKLEWALTKNAKYILDELESSGFDRDLALACLEKLVPQNELYTLDEESYE